MEPSKFTYLIGRTGLVDSFNVSLNASLIRIVLPGEARTERNVETVYQSCHCLINSSPDLSNSLTGRVKSHPPRRANLNSLSETFAAIVSDPSRPVHLVQTAETETRCTSEPSQERHRLCQFSPVSVQMVQNLSSVLAPSL